MAYRSDSDLEFLKNISSEELAPLVRMLTHDSDGEVRFTEELTNNSTYQRYYPDHNKYWELIAAEIQCFGANSFATMFRGGEGILYREVLTDVCDKLDVNYNSSSKISVIEDNLFRKVCADSIENMSSQDLKSLAESLGLKNTTSFTSESMVSIAMGIFNAGGFKSYQLSVIVANGVIKALTGTGLKIATNAGLTKVLSVMTGPIGWAITALWTAIDVAGGAYRVTIPTVIYVALLRKQQSDKIANNITFS